MASDFDPQAIPPQWVLDRAADKCGYEPQDVLHTGKDLAVCKEVQRPARVWAKARDGIYKVREVNGQESIQFLADGSRWMLRAAVILHCARSAPQSTIGLVCEAHQRRKLVCNAIPHQTRARPSLRELAQFPVQAELRRSPR